MSLLDHLWQSSLVVLLVYGLTLLLRDAGAAIRHRLWLAASVKFLLPFSLLATLGRIAFVQTVPAGPLAVLTKVRPVAMPFSAAAAPPLADHASWLPLLPAIWLLGTAAIATVWMLQWLRLRATVRSAKALASELAIPVKATSRLLEPGLVGIWRPVILLPEGLMRHLSRSEIEAILHHELCHHRRRDNLLACVHMLVTAIFWFHPLVWFVGARLEKERERACDESVLAGGKNPLDYAQAVLKVCRLYLRSPLPCAAGISGADLDQRITAIMAKNRIREIGAARECLLAALLAAAVLMPFVAGGLKSAPTARLVQRIADVLTPVPQTDIAAPAALPAAPAVIRHPRRKPALAVPPPATALVPPAFEPSPALVAASVPKFETAVQPDAGTSAANVCRPPQQLAGSRLVGPRVCLPQREWDRLKSRNLVLMPDGRTVTASYDRQHTLKAAISCTAPTSASSANSLGAGCF